MCGTSPPPPFFYVSPILDRLGCHHFSFLHYFPCWTFGKKWISRRIGAAPRARPRGAFIIHFLHLFILRFLDRARGLGPRPRPRARGLGPGPRPGPEHAKAQLKQSFSSRACGLGHGAWASPPAGGRRPLSLFMFSIIFISSLFLMTLYFALDRISQNDQKSVGRPAAGI